MTTKTFKTLAAAARHLGEQKGYTGGADGWIYDESGNKLTHGWFGTGFNWMEQGVISGDKASGYTINA